MHGYFQGELAQNFYNMEVWVENFKKRKVANLPFFKQINTENRIE